MRSEVDITGKRFGRLIAVRKLESYKDNKENYKYPWLFKCDCGKEKIINKYSVTVNGTISCGCLHKEKSTKHGLYVGLPKKAQGLQLVYRSIIQRCKDKKHPAYHNYGGRGITCEWATYEDFKKDMEKSYKLHIANFGKKNTQAGRIDNNKGYSKENCRWATCKENARNKRTNRIIIYQGKRMCIAEMAESSDAKASTIHSRLYNNYEDDELTKPIGYKNRKFRHREIIKKSEDKIFITKKLMEEFKKSATKVKIYLGVLDKREKEVIESRFGLKDGDKKTLQEVGDTFGLTRERIRQIENRAFVKMMRAEEIIT